MAYRPFLQRKGVISSDRLDHIEDGLARVAEGGGELPSWDEIPDKPATFPPGQHSHAVSEVDGLQSALDGKADTGDIPGAPAWGEVTGKPSSFPPDTHSHPVAEVEGLRAELDGKADAGDIPDVPEVPSVDFADLAGTVGGADGATLQAILEDMAARIQTLESDTGGEA